MISSNGTRILYQTLIPFKIFRQKRLPIFFGRKKKQQILTLLLSNFDLLKRLDRIDVIRSILVDDIVEPV